MHQLTRKVQLNVFPAEKKFRKKSSKSAYIYVHHNGKREDEWNENANASTVLKIGPWIYPFFGEAQNPLQG